MNDGLTHVPRRLGQVGWFVIATLSLALLVGSAPAPPDVSPSSGSTRGQVILGFDDSSAAALERGSYLRLTSKVLKGPLVPGVPRALRVTMANPFGFGVKVTSLKATARKTSVAGCVPGWIKVTSFKASKKRPPISVRAHKRANRSLTIQLVNLSSVNQDACKSAKFQLALTAKARRA